MQIFLPRSIFFILLLAGLQTHAQVKFSASATPSTVGKDEYVQLKLMVENAHEVEQIVPPDLGNFTIISGPNQESGMSMINGAVKRYIALSFILKPKKNGSFTIPPALAKADAGDYKSNPVKIKVTANPTGNSQGLNLYNAPFGGLDPYADPTPRSTFSDYILRKGEDPQEKISRNMFVHVEVDRKSCYVGEPVVATYKLFTRLKSESNMIKNPSFNGFSVLDLQQPNDMSYTREKFEGRDYNVYLIRKVQLYPLLPGELEVGIAEVENNVHFIKAEYANRQRDIFDDMFSDFADASIPAEGVENVKVTLKSKPITVSVMPLPDAGKPATFKGAVGVFDILAKVEHNNFTTDDAGNLAIIISGKGNLQLVNAPAVTWPDAVEGFDSKATDDLFKGVVPVSGRKIFEYPFTVSKPGTYTIPAVSFSYFDDREEKYKTVFTQPVTIQVARGTGKSKRPVVNSISGKEENMLTRFFSNRLRVVSLVAAIIVISLIVWLKRDAGKSATPEQVLVEEEKIPAEEEPVLTALDDQQNPLEAAAQSLQREDAGEFFKQLNLGLKNFLAVKLRLPAEELSRKLIAEQLDSKGISNETAVDLQELIDEIEWQLYTPFVDREKMKAMYNRANDLVQVINTYRI